MKKIIVYIAVFYLLINIYSLKANSNIWIVTEEKENIVNTSCNNVISFDDSQDVLITTSQTSINIYDQDEEKLVIEDKYAASELNIHNNKLYVASDIYLYIIDIKNYTYEKQKHNLYEVNDILIINNIIYLIGSKDEDACVLEITKDDMFEYLYGGQNYESFKKIIYMDNLLYIVGLKQAHSKNSPFINVGNENDLKSFITIIDHNNKEIIDTYYFNQLSKYEEVTSFNIYNENIYIVLETLESVYQYKLTRDLELLELYQINESYEQIYELVSFDKEKQEHHIYLIEENNIISILIYQNKNLLYKKELETKGKIQSFNLIDGVLYIYLVTNYGVVRVNVYEYLNLSNDVLVLNRLNNDYNNINHINVDSFFEDLSFEMTNSNPYFYPNINGEYNVTYTATRINAPKIETTLKVVVEPYVNIVNNGIYPPNINLLFFGNGYLNDEKITTGQVVKEPGHYILKIINVNNQIDIYHFDIVENYYKKVNNIYIPSIIEMKKNEEYCIEYNVNKKIDSFNINNQLSFDFKQDETTKLFIYSNKINIIDQYEITSINYYENDVLKQYLLNDLLLIRTLKNAPALLISESKEDKSFNINIDTVDDDQTLSYLKIVIYDNSKIIETKYNYFQEEKIRFNNIVINKPYDMKIYLIYELGGNDFYEEEIAKVNLTFVKESENTININSNIIDNKVETIKIEIINDKISFNDITLGTKNITEKYQDDNNNNILIIISISTSFLLLITTVLIYIYKRKKIIIRDS